MPKVSYNGNRNTSGTVPPDSVYNNGDQVTVLNNIGNLTKNNDTFAYWNTAANGTGTVYGAGSQFNIQASDVILFAQWYTTNGLISGGVTNHYQFSYDSVLATTALGNIEPSRTNALLTLAGNGRATCENDFEIMKEWFGGIELPYPYPISILVANLNGGARWGPPITLQPANGNSNLLRDLIVSEVTEMFMLSQNKGWGFNGVNDEESNGEGLSHFLEEQFQILTGRRSEINTENGWLWMNSSLPYPFPGIANHPRYDKDNNGNIVQDWGSRSDYVNVTVNNRDNTPASGCAVLFLYYLHIQLGYSIEEIIANAATTLAGVYHNLTGSNTDPFPDFKLLLGVNFPEELLYTNALPGKTDNPFPLTIQRQQLFEFDVEVEYQPATPKIFDNGTAKVKPFFNCEEKIYSFSLARQSAIITITPRWAGFYYPNYKWNINGAVRDKSDLLRTIHQNIEVFHPDPREPNGGTWTNEEMTLNFSFDFYGNLVNQNQILIINIPDVPASGNFNMTVSLEMNNSYFNPQFKSSIGKTINVNQNTILWDQSYKSDQNKCINNWEKEIHEKDKRLFFLFKTLPDPYILSELVKVFEAVEQLEKKDFKVAQQAKRFIIEQLKITPETLNALISFSNK